VGKSSLTNALLGKDRSIVTEISGTTRDRIDSVLRYQEREVVLIDTAGLRRKAKVKENVEFYSQLRTDRAIQECDVAVLLLDATQGLEAQDIRVLKQAEQLNKGIVVAVNKWDLVQKDSNSARDMERAIHERLRTLTYVPIQFVSALTGQRVYKLLDRALAVVDERNRRIPTSELNELILGAAKAYPPPMDRGLPVTLKYATQVRAAPPVFAVFSNRPKAITENYRRYLENKVRSAFGFEGVPIVFSFRKS
jgi:GTP-binding protein